MNYFLYSSLMVLVGCALISISRLLMYFFVKKISIGYLEYLIWIFAEISILAIFYVFLAYKVGYIDNFIIENPEFAYWDAIFVILKKTIANTTWMLLIPYIISFLYLYNEHLLRVVIPEKDLQIIEKEEGKVIQFKDDKNDVKFTLASDKIIYIESSDNYCSIKYINNEKLQDFMLRSTLKKLSEDLKDTPIQRCHRSFMINFEHVASLRRENTEICIEFDVNGIKETPVSRSYNDKIMESFVTYSKQK